MYKLLLLLILLYSQLADAQNVGHPLRLSGQFSTGDRYMEIRLLGALSLHGRKELAELSDLAWDEDEAILYGITDRGILLHLQPIIENNRLIDVNLLRHFRLRDDKGRKLKKMYADSEGLAAENANNGIRGDTLLAVSFEGINRIELYNPEGTYQRPIKLPDELRNPHFYKNGNKGLEALARHPEFGYMTGPEVSKTGTTIPIFSQSGLSWHYQPFELHGALVALETLDDGTLIILERAFSSIFEPLVISLSSAHPRRENRESILETRLLARFDSTQGWQTQNFEGLTRHQGKRYFMVSDDAGAGYLQTQLLYFEIP
ncbi:MAG: esterase-like activity of phytase family protein [Gammaproteobacteria bacterium]|nr:esterase-like activity of phytase family protein [Gammaproteobacteria bacterium]